MTDRLTPGILRDLAEITDRHARMRAASAFYVTSLTGYFREEAARREAEAKPQKRCDRLIPPVCLHPKACESVCTFGDGAMAYAASEGPGSTDAAQPAPAADDLLDCLAGLAMGLEQRGEKSAAFRIGQATTRIEAQAREIAVWQEAAGKNAVRAEQLEDMHEKTARDYGALKARVARLTEALLAIRGKAADLVHFYASTTAKEIAQLATAALAEAPDAQG